MDSEQFREFGKAAVDYLADYIENIRQRPVLPSVEPGYLRQMIPDSAPENPETWQEFLKDFERVIMPGMTHWTSPQFHAYYPTGNSYPGIVGEMLSAGMGCIGFSWIASPACTELEVEMMNWLGKLLGLPEEFLNCSEGPGGGIIQGSASEATLIGLLASKEKMINHLKATNPNVDEAIVKTKLVAYASDQSNSSVEKAGILGSVVMRLLQPDDSCRLRGSTFRKAVEDDIAKGLIPCYLVVNIGTTGTCAFDCMEELGPICKEYGIWMHIDAAYAGAAFVCPEYRHLMKGIEYADSFDFNPHKWMLVNFDCSAMWVRDANYLIDAFDVQRVYLKDNKSNSIPDYRHWQIPLGRRFRSIKLWAVLRLYGANGIRHHIRKQVALAERFESLVLADKRFEIVTEVNLGLVCFRIKGDNSLTKTLNEKLMERKNIYVIPCHYKDKSIIRFCVCSRLCENSDIDFAWKEIQDQTDLISFDENEIQISHPIPEKMDTEKFNTIDKLAITVNLQEKTK